MQMNIATQGGNKDLVRVIKKVTSNDIQVIHAKSIIPKDKGEERVLDLPKLSGPFRSGSLNMLMEEKELTSRPAAI